MNNFITLVLFFQCFMEKFYDGLAHWCNQCVTVCGIKKPADSLSVIPGESGVLIAGKDTGGFGLLIARCN